MSYHPPNQGYPPQYPPQQPYGYGPPPVAPQAGYPPQLPYGQPQAYPQPGAPGPYQGYPPQPQHHSPYPPQAPYRAPQHAPPPQHGYGAPAAYGPPPAQPSAGYNPNILPPTDMNATAALLRDSMKGFGTNEDQLIGAITSVPDAPHMLKLRHTYDDRFRRSLLKDVESETSGYFRDGLLALCRGPLLQDAYQVDRAISGLGTKETLLDDVVLGRSNADLIAIKACYSAVYKKDMAKEIREDLSLKTERLFDYVLAANRTEESVPVMPQEVEQNVDRLQQATEGTKFGTNQDVVCLIMASSSNGMIRAINQRYQAKFRRSLDDLFKRNFSGHMKDALRLMAARAVDPVKADADQLEDAMKGLGTKDEQLVTRMVRAQWDRTHWHQVKAAFKQYHKRDLKDRVHGETSGHYRKLLEALCKKQ